MCSFLAIGTTVYLLTTHSLEHQLRTNLESEVARLKTEYTSGGLPELTAEINEMIDSQSNQVLEYGVLNQDGQLLAGKFNQFKLTEGWQTLKLTLRDRGSDAIASEGRVVPGSHSAGRFFD